MPRVHYFGHAPVGTNSAITIEALRELRPAAIMFAVGAQGTKRLGMPGVNCYGVYSAKNFVYHYNQLPPFATGDFSTGKRVAIIGMGNVMVDIARWLLCDDPQHRTEEVVVVARRGPFEAKFDEKEFANIQRYLDRKAFFDELQRIKPFIAPLGQDVAEVPNETFPCLSKYSGQPSQARLRFRFLSSPFAIFSDRNGRMARLLLIENQLSARNGTIVAESTNTTAELDVDTMIFAIGDAHDPSLGLPFGPNGYVTNPKADDPAAKYTIFDPKKDEVLAGTYVVGWARKPSEGLVGIARHDGEVGATHVLDYVSHIEKAPSASTDDIARFLRQLGIQTVTKDDLRWLDRAEQREAFLRNVLFYKLDDDLAMLSAIEREKSAAKPPETAQLVAQGELT